MKSFLLLIFCFSVSTSPAFAGNHFLETLDLAVQPAGSVVRGAQAFQDLKKNFPEGTLKGTGGTPAAKGKFRTGPCEVATAYGPDAVSVTLTLLGENHACELSQNDPKFQEDILDPTYILFGNSDNSQNHPDPHGCRVALTSGAFYMVDFESDLMAVCRPAS